MVLLDPLVWGRVVLQPLVQFAELGLHLLLALLQNLSRVDLGYFHCVFQPPSPSHSNKSSFLPSWPWKKREAVLLLLLGIFPSSFFSHSLVCWTSWQETSLSLLAEGLSQIHSKIEKRAMPYSFFSPTLGSTNV